MPYRILRFAQIIGTMVSPFFPDSPSTPISPSPLIKEDQIETIVKRQAILRDWESSKLTKTEFARSRGICRSTFQRYFSRRQEGGFKGLIDRRKNRPKTGIKMDDRYTEIILTFLADKPKAPITAIEAEITKQALAKGWGTPPTYHKIRRFRKSIAADVLYQWSQGRKARVEDKSLTVRREVSTVNHLWQCDFSEIPLWTFDPTFGPELFKPWIVGTICCASRIVPATLVCKTVGAAEIITCWRKAMFAKGVPTCPFYGVPEIVSMDNHKVYKGDAWQSLMDLGVEPFFINNDSPEQNGKQERWFQTLQTKLISHLEGFADQHRGMDKAKKKCIPYPLLQKLIDDFVLEYHLSEHSSLGMTPWEAWHRGLADAHGLLVEASEVDRCLRVSREVMVSTEGVQVNNRKFIGTCLEGRVEQTVTVRFPPEGPNDSVDIYDHQLPLGRAYEHISAELAQEISTGRLERTIAIDQLAKRIKEMNAETPPAPVPETPAPKPVTEEITVPETPNQPDAKPENGPEEKLGDIPELPSDEGGGI